MLWGGLLWLRIPYRWLIAHNTGARCQLQQLQSVHTVCHEGRSIWFCHLINQFQVVRIPYGSHYKTNHLILSHRLITLILVDIPSLPTVYIYRRLNKLFVSSSDIEDWVSCVRSNDCGVFWLVKGPWEESLESRGIIVTRNVINTNFIKTMAITMVIVRQSCLQSRCRVTSSYLSCSPILSITPIHQYSPLFPRIKTSSS